MRTRSFRSPLLPLIAFPALALAAGCAHPGATVPANPATPTGAKVTEMEMEPIKIEATKGPDGAVQIESFDAADLFEQGGEGAGREAVRRRDRVLRPLAEGVRR